MEDGLNFRTEFDGAQPEVSDVEIETGKEIFTNAIDDIFLRHIEMTEVSRYCDDEAGNAEVSYALHFEIPLDSGSVVYAEVFRFDEVKDELVSSSDYGIDFMEIDGKTKEKASFFYMLDGGENGTPQVRRTDRMPEENNLQQALEDTEDEDMEYQADLIEEVLANATRNQKLEQKMRLNNQPVSSAEIKDALDFLSSGRAIFTY